MKIKQYKILKLFVVIALAILISQLVLAGHYVMSLIAMIISSLILFYFRKRVSEIIADERDYTIAGASSLLAMQIYLWIAVLSFFLIYIFKAGDIVWLAVANILAYSACIILFVYVLIFRLKTGNFKNIRSWVLFVITALILLGILVGGYFSIEHRNFSGVQNINNELIE